MSGMANWKAKIELDIKDLQKQLLEAEDSIDKITNEDRKVKLDIDTTILESAVQKLDRMLGSLSKGTGDFKQFENLSKELSSITSDINNISKAFSSMDDGSSFVNNIKSIDASLSTLSQHFVSEISGKMGTAIKNTKDSLSDIGNGQELDPLLQTISKIEDSIKELVDSVKNVNLSMNIDFGSNEELKSKVETKTAGVLHAYESLFNQIKKSGVLSEAEQGIVDNLNIGNFDGMEAKISEYERVIKELRAAQKSAYGKDYLRSDIDNSYWTAVSGAKQALSLAKKSSEKDDVLQNLFSGTDLSEVISQLTIIAEKLDNIVFVSQELKSSFDQGLNVNTSIEDIAKLTDRVKELEDELAKIKTPTTLPSNESNISLGNSAEQYKQITADTVSVLSDVGKTEDQIISKIQQERKEAEKNNEVLREHLVLLDSAGKVVANHLGSTSNVNGTFSNEQLSQANGGKIIHTHPGKASFFGGKDLQNLFQNSMYDQIKQIELVWGDSSLSIDKSTLTKESSSTILNIMRNVRKTLTEVYGNNEGGMPSQEAREHINAIEKEIFKTISQKLNVSVSENGSMANEVTESLSDIDKAIIKRFQGIKSSVVQDIDASDIIKSQMKDAFPDSSTNTKPETEGMEQVEKATEEAVKAKKDFATANEGVQSFINGSENPLKLEAELMEQIAKSAREAADAKKEFVEANKQVKDSADKSNNDLAGGHSENAEPSGVKKYKKKGYKAHDTGNHDNEKKVSNKGDIIEDML